MFSDEERRQIIEQARANAESPRIHIPEEDRLAAREFKREQAASLSRVAQECQRAFDSWTASSHEEVAEEPKSTSWEGWVEHKLAEQREFIFATIGEALGRCIAEERRAVRAEMLTEAHRLRAELTREFADNLREQKIQNAQLKETLAKLRVAATSEETPTLRTH
jgi:hypothetical protein